MPNEQLPVAPPAGQRTIFSSDPSAVPSKRKKGMLLLIVGMICVLLLGVGRMAYLMKIGPFAARAPYTEKYFLSGLLGAISRIDTSSYALSASVSVGTRDSDAAPFTSRLPKNTQLRKQYQPAYRVMWLPTKQSR